MARPAKPAPVTCPECGRESDRAPHYCPGCGYDYWRGVSHVAAPSPVPEAPVTTASQPRTLMLVGAAGLLLAVVVTAVSLGAVDAVGSGIGQLFGQQVTIPQTRPSRTPEDFLLSRFFRQVRDPRAEFRFTRSGTLRQLDPPGGQSRYREELVLAGDEWAAHGVYGLGSGDDAEPDEVWVMARDGRLLVRETEDGDWLEGEAPQDSLNPFKHISAVSEVAYVESRIAAEGTLHLLLVTKWMGGTQDDVRRAGVDRLGDRTSRFEIWVNDSGIPIRAHHVSTYELRHDGASATFQSEAELRFHDWDAVGEIEVPEVDLGPELEDPSALQSAPAARYQEPSCACPPAPVLLAAPPAPPRPRPARAGRRTGQPAS